MELLEIYYEILKLKNKFFGQVNRSDVWANLAHVKIRSLYLNRVIISMFSKYLLLLACILLNALPANAGDLMNVEFLQANAKKSNTEIQSINQYLSQYLYNNPPSTKEFILNTVSNGLFTATYFITGIGLMRGVGTAAGGLFYVPYPLNYLKTKKANKEVQNHLQHLVLLNGQIDTRVKDLYAQWKEGSPSAKDELVQLTNPSIVNEVETNIRLESALLKGKED